MASAFQTAVPGSGLGTDTPASPGAFRADIQALRGVAILLVLLHHARVPGVPGGFLGVDIFFVISGYLMTGLIDEALVARRFALGGFYARRIRRLFPAAYATLLVTAIAAPFLLDGYEHRQFVAQLAGAFTFTANIVLWDQSDYFGTYARLKPLLHMWSLSVEEQFYLCLPLLLLWSPARMRLPLAILATIASLALCLYMTPRAPSASFYMLPTRAWELALGSVLVLAVRRGVVRPAPPRAARLACAALLVAIPLAFDERGHPGLPAIGVCLATALLLVPDPSASGSGKALRPLGWIGDRSYSLYLVHWPVFAFANNVVLTGVSPTLGAALLPVCLLWAELQFRLVERPLRRFAFTPAAVALLIGLPIVTVLASAVWTHRLVPGAVDRTPSRGLAQTCVFTGDFVETPTCRTGPAPTLLIWGDSFAMHLVPGIRASSDQPIVQATRQACGPLLGLAPTNGEQQSVRWGKSCIAFNDSVLAYLARTPSIDTVVLSSSLGQYIPEAEAVRWRAVIRTADGFVERAADTQTAYAALARTASVVRALGKKIVLIGPPPAAGFDIAQCLDRHRLGLPTVGASATCDFPVGAYRAHRGPVIGFVTMVERRGLLPVLRLDRRLCEGGVCRVTLRGAPLYRDHAHLSPSGSRLLGEQMRWGRWIATR